MKREEAIKMIQDDMRLHHDYLSGKYRKALRMAIESLQADRPHGIGYVGVKDDYPVSVKEVLNITAETGALETQRRIKELQPIDRPHGEWVEVVERTEQYDREGVKTWATLYQCSNCGFVLNAIEGHIGQYNFCPNCGADMRKEKE